MVPIFSVEELYKLARDQPVEIPILCDVISLLKASPGLNNQATISQAKPQSQRPKLLHQDAHRPAIRNIPQAMAPDADQRTPERSAPLIRVGGQPLRILYGT